MRSLPVLAEAIGAKPPRHVPRWLGRLLGGPMATMMMEESRGASNAKAKRELGWQPYFSSWRQGFREGLTKVPEAAVPAKGYVVRAMSEAETAELEQLRSRAFAIAYRMLGSVGDAEDIAQEALIRFHSAKEAGEAIDSPPAYVATIATRLAIDELRSARARRETYVGEWLPEPLPTAADEAARPAGATAFPDPEAQAELADSLSLAFLVLLERLTPEQRAALLLHDVFDYPHEEVASIIGTTPAASRQLASRARRQVDERRPRFQSSAERRSELAARFFDAVQSGDLGRLEALLADDVVLKGDGGGKVPALARPLQRPQPGREGDDATGSRPVGGLAGSASSRPSSTASPARSRASRTAACSARWSSRATASGSPGSTRSSTRKSSGTSATSPTTPGCCAASPRWRARTGGARRRARRTSSAAVGGKPLGEAHRAPVVGGGVGEGAAAKCAAELRRQRQRRDEGAPPLRPHATCGRGCRARAPRGPATVTRSGCGSPSATSAIAVATSTGSTGCTRAAPPGSTRNRAVEAQKPAIRVWNCVARTIVAGSPEARTNSSCSTLIR